MEKGIRIKTSSYAATTSNVSMCRAKYSGVLRQLDPGQYGGRRARLRRSPAARRRWLRRRRCRREPVRRQDGRIYEPEIASALIGITRASVIHLPTTIPASTVIAKRLTRDDSSRTKPVLHRHRRRVTPIRELDRRTIGAGTPRPDHAQNKQTLFFDVERQAPQYSAG